jgi:hypothetical protein
VVAVLSSADGHHPYENLRHAACASRQRSKQCGAARPDSIDGAFETVNRLDDKEYCRQWSIELILFCPLMGPEMLPSPSEHSGFIGWIISKKNTMFHHPIVLTTR